MSRSGNTELESIEAQVEDEDDEDYVDEDEDDEMYGSEMVRERYKPSVTAPQEKGMELLFGGEFGKIHHQLQSRAGLNNLARNVISRSLSSRPMRKEDLACDLIPNSSGTAVASYDSNAYVGQYSSDSTFYYTCGRSFKIHVYDTTKPLRTDLRQVRGSRDGHATSMEVIKTVNAVPGGWTITDSHLSPDNQRMIYASVTNVVHMTSTADSSAEQIPIDFSDPSPRRGRRNIGAHWYERDDCSIWSCKFSADGCEVIAGGSSNIFVYDLLADRRTVKIDAHTQDVNSCCWADTASGNVLVSASDDTFVKVWDRRSLSNKKPSGVLIGNTEGITYVSAKGDGRYVISNGKDQILRLWDLRMMRTNHEYEEVADKQYGIPHYDYRGDRYPHQRYKAHPLDCSVMKYTGHSVLRTLIRCHFSPTETTGQQYIYSGSADGRIHIWSLDGRVVQVLDRSFTLPIGLDPSDVDVGDFAQSRVQPCVRDVSWHSQASQPILMSTGWLGVNWGRSDGSVVARHEWKGLTKIRGGLEDLVERERLERGGQSRTLRQRMPGAFEPESPLSDGTMLVTSDKEARIGTPVPPLEADLNNHGFPRGYFMLRSIGTDRVLDVTQGFSEDGTPVILWPSTESSLVDSMRRPECNNQVFFIDTSGALCSRSAGHAIDIEGESPVVRHRRPVSLPFPNAHSHPLPRFAYNPDTKEITVVFTVDPALRGDADAAGAGGDAATASAGAWKEKTYYLSSVPVRNPPTMIANASTLLTSAVTSSLSLFGVKQTNATPEEIFDGQIDLTEHEIAEQDRNEAEEVDDSVDALRPVKVVGLTAEEARNASGSARLRRQWEVLPLRNNRHRTGASR
ncbi:WD40 repeat-like protein [Epithele typhae]|uniref:WD40 repeat-like protein n=1 Tax=Epithele typhae TaxID=378194 RepID=UPI002007C1F8|nr:WD40 repeat-like protein [Epithele typhae]KAH9944278.1 WD40 repeat-like protein [Epithele typhae]